MNSAFSFKISLTESGGRLDQMVSERMDFLSRSRVAGLIKEGCILVGEKTQKPGYRIRPGDEIRVFLPREADVSRPGAETLSLDVIHQDRQVMVINKPPGLVVHPGAGNPSGTLVNALLNFDPGIRGVGGDESRPGIVHRLDKDTSGVMVVARTPAAFEFLHREFLYRRVQKRYLALASGEIRESSGRIDLPVGRHPKKRKMMMAGLPGGRSALTLWQVVCRYGRSTLVEVELKTGRTHQIRVHFRALGYPLVGDILYGFKRKKKHRHSVLGRVEAMAERQMLHAWKLSFRHPFSGKRMDISAPLPRDMESIISSLDQSLEPGTTTGASCLFE